MVALTLPSEGSQSPDSASHVGTSYSGSGKDVAEPTQTFLQVSIAPHPQSWARRDLRGCRAAAFAGGAAHASCVPSDDSGDWRRQAGRGLSQTRPSQGRSSSPPRPGFLGGLCGRHVLQGAVLWGDSMSSPPDSLHGVTIRKRAMPGQHGP